MEHLPEAAVVFDRFHIVKPANEAIDEVRRSILRTLNLAGHKAIKGTRYLLLRGKEYLLEDQHPLLAEALKWNEPLSLAYYLKEDLRQRWEQPSQQAATEHLQAWILQAMSTDMQPIKRLAKRILRHAKGILNYLKASTTRSTALCAWFGKFIWTASSRAPLQNSNEKRWSNYEVSSEFRW